MVDPSSSKAPPGGDQASAPVRGPVSDAGERSGNLDLGIIGNGILSSLIDRRGRHVWHCLERFDGVPVFCSLLSGRHDDRHPAPDDGGFMDVELDRFARSEQRYRGNTAILETLLIDDAGHSVRLVDFAPRFEQYEQPYRPRLLIRRIEPLEGSCRIRIRIRPRFDWGAECPTLTVASNHIRYVDDGAVMRVTTDAAVSYVAEERWFVLERPVTLILGPDEPVTSSIDGTARTFLRHTEEYWLGWTRHINTPFEWQDAVIRAAITLKLCNFEETGGIVAAMTTSIPEAPNTERNWDYRYCWLRDAYFVVRALNRLGTTRTMEEFIGYITNAAALAPDEPLKPVYGIVPGTPMPEHAATALPGFRGMGPVRVGNEAESQIQNDSYGSVILAAAQMFYDRRLPRSGDRHLFERLEALGDWAVKLAFAPDAGLWEYRGKPAIHTHSSVMCWAACDRLGKMANVLGLPDRERHWHAHADAIKERILASAWNAGLDSFVASFGGDDIDASLLLLAEVGFLPATDPRYLGTLALVEKRLKRGNFLFRYDHEDDFGLPKVSFTICTFWYIDALVAVGRLDEARGIFESVLASRNHLGLLSEDLDQGTGELWGNFPQSYSMVGLILSAMRLSMSWEDAFRQGL
jgi:GH15 family glucan-1,4-alpha-glucosidase